ncbi:hypothetical protein FRC06_005627 [Ceratobasidium sp. 370]|nr:hypothetical protein FRC06_005627 [Ceratobasidium sp. 370]
MDSRHRTAEQRDDPSIKTFFVLSAPTTQGADLQRPWLSPGGRVATSERASAGDRNRASGVVQWYREERHRAESNVTTREHSLPSIATLEDEGEDEDEYEEDKDMEEGDEDEDWDDEDWEAEGEEEDEEEEP